ncbi:hypothetical protein F5Y03DRAFT_357436 [Xylaria venustula]|nr:hypothetical protein F5Y03DRAFT_357436 [Xylaria venustula]
MVLKYLVEKGKADLSCQDIYGRSAIFYALWDHPTTEMLEYIASTIPLGPIIMNHQHIQFRYNPLELAVQRRVLGAVEFLLGLGLNAETVQNCRPVTWDVVSLFGFRELMGVIPKPTIWVCEFEQQKYIRYSCFQLGEREFGAKDSHVVWVHIPWANGILFFFALRRYGQQMGYQTSKTDWLPALFRQRVKVASNLALPYTDPLYGSNFGLFPVSLTPARSFIIFPCLVLRSRGVQKKVRHRIDEIRAKMTRKLSQALIHSDRTLDEAYFPSLSTGSLDVRNKSQVVSRECTETVDGEPTNEDTEPILMVAQLWLWRCGQYILTAFSESMIEDSLSLGPVDHVRMPGMGNNILEPVSPGVQTGLLIAHQISAFGKPQINEKFPSPLDIFEASAAHVLEDCDRYMDPSVSSLPDIEKEKDFMFRIVDIREELAMIQEILGQQLELLRNYIDDYEDNNPDSLVFIESPLRSPSQKLDIRFWEKVTSSENTIETYQKRVEKINRDAERVEKMIQDQLNLKRTYASIEDTRSSIRLGIAGLILSTAVIGFTVITIIFAPLAFVTALFALPIDSLVRNQVTLNGAGGNSQAEDGIQSTSVYTTRYVGTWFAVAEILSLGITIFFVVLGLWLVRRSESFAALQGTETERAGRQRRHGLWNNSGENTAGANRAAVAESEPNQRHTGFRRRAAHLLSRRKEGESSEV